MTNSKNAGNAVPRRTVLAGGLAALGVMAVGAVTSSCSRASENHNPPAIPPHFAALEQEFAGRLGVYALDTGSGTALGNRQSERFLMCSTVKVFIVSAILTRRRTEPGLLEKRIHYTNADILDWAPVTPAHIADGMTVEELCAAAVSHSDNTAANLLIAELGGPEETEKFVRSIGDSTTNTDRTETDLDIPDGDKDTSTPEQLVSNLRTLVLGDALDREGRDKLIGWMKANTTGDQSIRAGVPHGWEVGDKTGSGSRGESNDIAVIWPPNRAPILLAVLTAPDDQTSTKGKLTIAQATRQAISALGA